MLLSMDEYRLKFGQRVKVLLQEKNWRRQFIQDFKIKKVKIKIKKGIQSIQDFNIFHILA